MGVEVPLATKRQNRNGLFYALASFTWWAGSVFYFKAVAHVSPLEVLAHRVIWTAVILGAGLVVGGRINELVAGFRARKTLVAIVATTLLIGSNWYLFIWAIANDRVLDTSLAYYISPLINVILGAALLKERFRLLQAVGVVLAFGALALQGFQVGGLPLISLYLALSFSIYGLIRKVTTIDPVVGTAAEMVALTPIALVVVALMYERGELAFASQGPATDLLLVAAGVVTAVPQIWFLRGAKRLPYATLGVVQFTLPSLTFIIAVFVFHEPFTTIQLVSFTLVWAAISLYCTDAWRIRVQSSTTTVC